MISMVKASIIITTYRRSDVLLRAIESCTSQTYKDIEIIVVDDNGLGSPFQQETEVLLHDLIKGLKIKYLPLDKNCGACYARNAGVAAAEGEYLFFLDDDDEFLPERVERQVAILDENPDLDGHTIGFIRKRNGVRVVASDGVPVIGDFISFLKNGNFYTPMLAIRRTSLVEMGGFRNIPRYQDMYLMYHLLSQDKVIGASDEALYICHEHRDEQISKRGVDATEVSLMVLKEFVKPYRSQISDEDWLQMRIRRMTLLASTYYSSNYFNRLKSIPLWIRIYKLSKDKVNISYVVKSLFPSAVIKKMEQIKHHMKIFCL